MLPGPPPSPLLTAPRDDPPAVALCVPPIANSITPEVLNSGFASAATTRAPEEGGVDAPPRTGVDAAWISDAKLPEGVCTSDGEGGGRDGVKG